MRLYTKSSLTNIGLLKKRAAWLFDYQLQLTQDEQQLVRTYQYGDFTVGTFGDEKTTCYVDVDQAVTGKKGSCFEGFGLLLNFENSLIEGCKRLAAMLEELRRVSASPERIFDITADSVQPVSLSPKLNDQNANKSPLPPPPAMIQPEARL